MTKSEFQELQAQTSESGTTLKEFLRSEGVAYSTYNYRCKKAKVESMPIAPISIRKERQPLPAESAMQVADLPGVTLAFPNGVRAHFGRVIQSLLATLQRVLQIMLTKKITNFAPSTID